MAASLRDAFPVSEPDHVEMLPEFEAPEVNDMAEEYFPADSRRSAAFRRFLEGRLKAGLQRRSI